MHTAIVMWYLYEVIRCEKSTIYGYTQRKIAEMLLETQISVLSKAKESNENIYIVMFVLYQIV